MTELLKKFKSVDLNTYSCLVSSLIKNINSGSYSQTELQGELISQGFTLFKASKYSKEMIYNVEKYGSYSEFNDIEKLIIKFKSSGLPKLGEELASKKHHTNNSIYLVKEIYNTKDVGISRVKKAIKLMNEKEEKIDLSLEWWEIISKVNPNHIDLIKMIFKHKYTLELTGSKLNITREAVRQTVNRVALSTYSKYNDQIDEHIKDIIPININHDAFRMISLIKKKVSKFTVEEKKGVISIDGFTGIKEIFEYEKMIKEGKVIPSNKLINNVLFLDIEEVNGFSFKRGTESYTFMMALSISMELIEADKVNSIESIGTVKNPYYGVLCDAYEKRKFMEKINRNHAWLKIGTEKAIRIDSIKHEVFESILSTITTNNGLVFGKQEHIEISRKLGYPDHTFYYWLKNFKSKLFEFTSGNSMRVNSLGFKHITLVDAYDISKPLMGIDDLSQAGVHIEYKTNGQKIGDFIYNKDLDSMIYLKHSDFMKLFDKVEELKLEWDLISIECLLNDVFEIPNALRVIDNIDIAKIISRVVKGVTIIGHRLSLNDNIKSTWDFVNANVYPHNKKTP